MGDDQLVYASPPVPAPGHLVPCGKIGLRMLGAFAVVAVVGIGLGLRRMVRLKAPPQVVTITVPRWATVTQDDQVIGKPLSDAMRALADVRFVESRTTEDGVLVTVTAPSAAHGELPLVERVRSALEPVVLPDVSASPLVQVVALGERTAWLLVEAPQVPAVQLREWAAADLEDILLRAPGVRSVALCGPEPARPQVLLDAAKLRAFGLSPTDVLRAVTAAGVGLHGGSGGPPLDALEGLRLAEKVRLSDVAQVMMESPPASCLAFRRGAQVVLAEVTLAPTAAPVSGKNALPTAVAPAGITVIPWGEAIALDVWLADADPEKLKPLFAQTADGPVLIDGPARPRGAATLLTLPWLDEARLGHINSPKHLPPGVLPRGLRGASGVRVVLSGGPEAALATAVSNVVARFPRATPPIVPLPPRRSSEAWQLDVSALARAGVPLADAASVVRLATTGEWVTGVVLRLPAVEATEQLADVEVAKGVRLRDVAVLQKTDMPAEVLRMNGEPAAELIAPGLSVSAVEDLLNDLALPSAVAIHVEPLDGRPGTEQ